MSELTFRDSNQQLVLLMALKGAIDDLVTETRVDRLEIFSARYDKEGTKSFDVKLPNDLKVAGISLSVPHASTDVVDQDALTKWAEANLVDLFQTVTTPARPAQFIAAQPERTETVLNMKRVTEFLERLKPVDPAEAGSVVDPETGALVDGVTYTPEGKPKSFSVRFTPDGREEVARAYRNGLLSHLVGGTPLPAIETTGSGQ